MIAYTFYHARERVMLYSAYMLSQFRLSVRLTRMNLSKRCKLRSP